MIPSLYQAELSQQEKIYPADKEPDENAEAPFLNHGNGEHCNENDRE